MISLVGSRGIDPRILYLEAVEWQSSNPDIFTSSAHRIGCWVDPTFVVDASGVKTILLPSPGIELQLPQSSRPQPIHYID